MIRHLLGDFKLAAVAQIFRYSGSTERMTSDFRMDFSALSSPSDHAINIRLRQSIFGKLIGFTRYAAKQKSFAIGQEESHDCRNSASESADQRIAHSKWAVVVLDQSFLVQVCKSR